MNTSKSYSREANNGKKGNKSARERKEGAFVKIHSVDQLDKRTTRNDPSSDGSKHDAKNPGKSRIGDANDKHHPRHPFCDIIGKREQRKVQLEKMEGDLRQRLDALECSMPAVMVWNIWRMAQGAPCRIKHILEKQFEKKFPYPITPSRHYDCRVREIEAERKLAARKMEEARNLWSEKLAVLEERKSKLEEARRIQEQQKDEMKRLSEEAKLLQEKSDEPCRCECGDTQCKQSWVDTVPSVTSVKSGDIECLEKLQRLAEEEMSIKRDIAELERREASYMTTLQQADELWSKVEGDLADVSSTLQEQLEMKTAANQKLADRICELEDSLEKCRTRMVACRGELEKYLSIEKIEAMIGREDDLAEVIDKEIIAKPPIVHRRIGEVDDVALVEDAEVIARVEVVDEEALVKVPVIDTEVEAVVVVDDKYVSVVPDVVDVSVDLPVDLVRVDEVDIVKPEDVVYTKEDREKEIRDYLAQLTSLEDLYKEGVPCAPDFICSDLSGMTEEELVALGVDVVKREDGPPIIKFLDAKPPIEKDVIVDRPIPAKLPEVNDFVLVKRSSILSWIDIIDSIRERTVVQYTREQHIYNSYCTN